jgi:hypothetical protein
VKTIIDISLCPTSLEFDDGSRYDHDAVLDAIREFARETYQDGVVFSCLQVGHQQGDEWASVDGFDEDGALFLDAFFAARGGDEDLFASVERWSVIRNCNFHDRDDRRGQRVLAALRLADCGCDEIDLIGSLDELDSTLALLAESTLAEDIEACDEAEDAVENAVDKIEGAFIRD